MNIRLPVTWPRKKKAFLKLLAQKSGEHRIPRPPAALLVNINLASIPGQSPV